MMLEDFVAKVANLCGGCISVDADECRSFRAVYSVFPAPGRIYPIIGGPICFGHLADFEPD
jgi:hypothetical protein